MTQAPECLKAGRRLLLDVLDFHENTSKHPADLDPAEVGIVPDPAHRGGYHCGRDRVNPTRDYSVIESARDRTGLNSNACALDIGWFETRVAGKSHDLRSFSLWLVAQCRANAPDTTHIREIIYSPDGRIVKRFDRLNRRSTGDRSHLTHTHLSFFRDSIAAGRDVCVTLFRRYLLEIGLLAGKEDTTMAVGDDIYRLLEQGLRPPGTAQTSGGGVPVAWIVREIANIKNEQGRAALRDEALLAAVTEDDSAAVLARIDAKAAELAAAIAEVSEAVDALDADDPPEQLATQIREQLGDDKAAAVAPFLTAA